jgi:hypothetical protein
MPTPPKAPVDTSPAPLPAPCKPGKCGFIVMVITATVLMMGAQLLSQWIDCCSAGLFRLVSAVSVSRSVSVARQELERLQDANVKSSHGFAFCLPVVYGDLNVQYLQLWSDYQRKLGFDVISVYHVEGNLLSQHVLSWMVGAGWEVEKLPRPVECQNGTEGLYSCAQGAAVDACFRKALARSLRWVMFGDLDEFYTAAPGTADISLQMLVKGDDRASHFSFGVMQASVDFCNKTVHPGSLLYGFTYVAPHKCFKGQCTGWFGKRKALVRPGLVRCCGVHTWSTLQGRDYHAVEMNWDSAVIVEVWGAATRVNFTTANAKCSSNRTLAQARGLAYLDWGSIMVELPSAATTKDALHLQPCSRERYQSLDQFPRVVFYCLEHAMGNWQLRAGYGLASSQYWWPWSQRMFTPVAHDDNLTAPR